MSLLNHIETNMQDSTSIAFWTYKPIQMRTPKDGFVSANEAKGGMSHTEYMKHYRFQHYMPRGRKK